MPAAVRHPHATPQDAWLATSMPVKIQTSDTEYHHQDPSRRQSDSFLNWDEANLDDKKNDQPASLSLSTLIEGRYEDEDEASSISSPIETPSLESVWAGDQSSCGNISLQSSLSSSTSISPVTPDYPTFSSGGFCNIPVSSPRIGIKEESQQFNYNDFAVNPELWMNWDNSGLLNIAPSISPNATQLKTEPPTPRMASAGDVLPTPALETSADALLDTSIAFQDAVEEPLFPTPLPTPQEISLRAHGDSSQAFAEQAWNRQHATRNNSSASAQNQHQQQSYFYPTLSPAEEANLRAIAMPSKASSSSMTNSTDESTPGGSSGRGMRPRKRKSSPLTEEDDDEDEPQDSAPQPPVKKTAHNMIEKRYRTNLNDKIAALRQSVPSLRVTEKSINGNGRRGGGDVMEDLEGLTPANKLNKATILSKATEYIGHLERRNQALMREKQQLNDRIMAFENLIMGRNNAGQGMYTPDQLMVKHEMMDQRGGQHNERRSGRQHLTR